MAATLAEEHERLLPMMLTSFWLTTILLSVGGLANAYLVWLTARCRFPVHWETFRLVVRYSSIVDLSLCAILASVVLWPYLLIHTRSDVMLTAKCARYDRDSMQFIGAILVGCGVVVAARQTVTLLTFHDEEALLRRNRMRTVRLLRDVAIVGVVLFVTSELCKRFVPVFQFSLCYVVGKLTSRAVFLLLVPIVVSVILGAVIVMRADVERPRSSRETSGTAKLTEPSSEVDRAPEEVVDSRWNRGVIVTHVAAVTWFTMSLAMAAAGVLTEPVTADTLYVLTSCTSLISAWSLYAVVRYWTVP